ncbi:MAG TPA: hypothetical protein VK835_02770 [Bacteroidia bacterium]|jgi:hypothetical protein|nr:hypothetical protein [Bacteroidia bacterium]
MKKLLTILLFASAFNLKAQTNYIITRDGQKVSIDWAASLSISTEGYVDVFPKDGEKTPDGKKVITYKEPKYMRYEGRNWLTLPMGNPKFRYDWRIQEVLCWTDKYIMTNWEGENSYSILIFDWNLNLIKLRQARDYIDLQKQAYAFNYKLNTKVFDKELKHFFEDCTAIINQVAKNNSSKEYTFTDGLSGLHCGTKDINTVIQGVVSGSLDHYPTK